MLRRRRAICAPTGRLGARPRGGARERALLLPPLPRFTSLLASRHDRALVVIASPRRLRAAEVALSRFRRARGALRTRARSECAPRRPTRRPPRRLPHRARAAGACERRRRGRPGAARSEPRRSAIATKFQTRDRRRCGRRDGRRRFECAPNYGYDIGAATFPPCSTADGLASRRDRETVRTRSGLCERHLARRHRNAPLERDVGARDLRSCPRSEQGGRSAWDLPSPRGGSRSPMHRRSPRPPTSARGSQPLERISAPLRPIPSAQYIFDRFRNAAR